MKANEAIDQGKPFLAGVCLCLFHEEGGRVGPPSVPRTQPSGAAFGGRLGADAVSAHLEQSSSITYHEPIDGNVSVKAGGMHD